MIKAEWTKADALDLQPTCNNLATDCISRQALCEYALNQKDKSITANDVMRFPSAKPEIIHCRDCQHHSHDAGYGRDWCNRMSGVFRVEPDDYCSFAKRRTNEVQNE